MNYKRRTTSLTCFHSCAFPQFPQFSQPLQPFFLLAFLCGVFFALYITYRHTYIHKLIHTRIRTFIRTSGQHKSYLNHFNITNRSGTENWRKHKSTEGGKEASEKENKIKKINQQHRGTYEQDKRTGWARTHIKFYIQICVYVCMYSYKGFANKRRLFWLVCYRGRCHLRSCHFSPFDK